MKNKSGLAPSLSKAVPTGRQGFTLIELLIVIAIIGILASVILVSLNSARNKSNGAALKNTLSSLKAAVALCCSTGTNPLLSAAGGPLCANSPNTLLPDKIILKTTAIGYWLDGAEGCSSSKPAIWILVTGAKNTACGGAGTAAIWYHIFATDIYYYDDATDSDIHGFPPGC